MMRDAEDDDDEEEVAAGESGDLGTSAEEEADVIEEDAWAQRGGSVSTLSSVDRMSRVGHERPSTAQVNDGNSSSSNPAAIRTNGSDVTQTTDNKIWQLVGNVSGQAVSFRGNRNQSRPTGGFTFSFARRRVAHNGLQSARNHAPEDSDAWSPNR
jgi:hypothetical protein